MRRNGKIRSEKVRLVKVKCDLCKKRRTNTFLEISKTRKRFWICATDYKIAQALLSIMGVSYKYWVKTSKAEDERMKMRYEAGDH